MYIRRQVCTLKNIPTVCSVHQTHLLRKLTLFNTRFMYYLKRFIRRLISSLIILQSRKNKTSIHTFMWTRMSVYNIWYFLHWTKKRLWGKGVYNDIYSVCIKTIFKKFQSHVLSHCFFFTFILVCLWYNMACGS